jgi:hypothetical protein
MKSILQILFLVLAGLGLILLLNFPTIKSWVSTRYFNQDKLWSLIQSWRSSEGLQPYIKDQKICTLTAQRINDVQTNYSHDGFAERVNKYPGEFSENLVGIDGKNEKAVLQKWLDSPEHREALERPYKNSCLACKNNYCVQIFSNLSKS